MQILVITRIKQAPGQIAIEKLCLNAMLDEIECQGGIDALNRTQRGESREN